MAEELSYGTKRMKATMLLLVLFRQQTAQQFSGTVLAAASHEQHSTGSAPRHEVVLVVHSRKTILREE